jgi:lipopolysaccharide export system protein LptA
MSRTPRLPGHRDRLSAEGMTRVRLPLSGLALRGLAAGLLAGGVASLSFGSVADAQAISGFNTNQPVQFNADRIELQDRQNRVVLSGSVQITQGDLQLNAERTTISYTDTGTLTIQRLDATGGVVVTRGNERASGAAGVYDFNRKVIILSGGVNLRRGGDSLSGGRLVIDLNSGLSSVDGSGAAQGGNSGRVSGTFSVPDQN